MSKGNVPKSGGSETMNANNAANTSSNGVFSRLVSGIRDWVSITFSSDAPQNEETRELRMQPDGTVEEVILVSAPGQQSAKPKGNTKRLRTTVEELPRLYP